MEQDSREYDASPVCKLDADAIMELLDTHYVGRRLIHAFLFKLLAEVCQYGRAHRHKRFS